MKLMLAKSGSSYKKTFKLIIMPQSTVTDITVTINGVEANWVASNGGYYDGSIETTDEIANVIVKARINLQNLQLTEDGEPAPTLVDRGNTSKAYTIALTEATDTAKIYTIYVQSAEYFTAD